MGKNVLIMSFFCDVYRAIKYRIFINKEIISYYIIKIQVTR